MNGKKCKALRARAQRHSVGMPRVAYEKRIRNERGSLMPIVMSTETTRWFYKQLKRVP